MPLIPINAVGGVGVIQDKPPHELPFPAWNDARNMRFRDTYAEKMLGHAAVYDPPGVAPYYIQPVVYGSNYYWLVLGLAAAHCIDGVIWHDITRTVGGAYGATANENWTGCSIGGIPVVNNGVDAPQMWLTPDPATKLAALSNWPSGYTCKALRSFKSFLVALDVHNGSVRYPQMVKWSHPADIGAVPSSWDPTDPTKDAGEYSLMESPGFCIDALAIRDVLAIYKDDSVWTMQYIGGVNVFRFARVFSTIGMLTKRCAVEFFDGKHLTVSQDDVVVHNVNSAESILNRRMKRWLFNNIDTTHYRKTFVVHNLREREVWVCFPESGVTHGMCNLALVWNYVDNQIGVREIPKLAHASLGLIDASFAGTAWSSDSATWDSDPTGWGDGYYSSASPRVLMADPIDTKLFDAENTMAFDGTPMTSYLIRTGLGVPFKTGEPPDISSRKFFRAIWPRIEGTDGGVIRIRLGAQERVDAPVSWQETYDFVIGTDEKVDCTINGRLLAVRFESDTDIDWRLHGYDVDVIPAGSY